MRALLTLLLVVVATSCGYDVPQEVLVRGDYERVWAVEDLPEAVRREFFIAIRADDTYGVANPDEDWADGCVIDRDHPLHQLIYAGQIDPYWLVAFRSGGFAVGEELYVFHVVDGRVTKAWSDMRRPNGESAASFVSRLESGDKCFVSPPRRVYFAEEEECLSHGT